MLDATASTGQKVSFQRRSAAKVTTGDAFAVILLAAIRLSMIACSLQRRKGLVAFSMAIVLGIVGWPIARFALSRATLAINSLLSGSTALAKRKLASVYSCAQ